MDSREIGEFLNSKGIKPTHSRVEIYNFLYENRIHPSVETIYSALIKVNPYMSKTTVYNTLREFSDKEIIKELKIADGKSIFDADTSEHGHFLCKECGKVFDFRIYSIDSEPLPDFIISRREVYAEGVCRECRQKNKN